MSAHALFRGAEQVHSDPTISDPIYCLLEKDSLVTGINVHSERLLTAPNAPMTQVKLTIGVDVRVTDSRAYNLLFLGD